MLNGSVFNELKVTKIFYMTTQKKTNVPLLICIISFALGMIIGAWGWDKHESTIAARTVGSVFMMWTGGIMIVGGLLGMLLIGGKTKR
jgi:TRAP-type C4-dicarboxylate transport system permease small subunit